MIEGNEILMVLIETQWHKIKSFNNWKKIEIQDIDKSSQFFGEGFMIEDNCGSGCNLNSLRIFIRTENIKAFCTYE